MMSGALHNEKVVQPNPEFGDCRQNTAEAEDEPVVGRTPDVEHVETQRYGTDTMTQHRLATALRNVTKPFARVHQLIAN